MEERPEQSEKSKKGPSTGKIPFRGAVTKPTRLGDFELRREIGRGGMGTVFEAWQRSLQRTVALKVLGRQVSSSESAVIRFQREAQAAAKLHHAHIVPIFALGEEDGQYYYAMELVHGPGLNTIIARARAARDAASGDSLAETVLLPRARRLSAPEGSREDDSRPAPEGDSGVTLSVPSGELTGEPAGEQMGALSGSDSFTYVARHIATIADALDYAHREGVIHRDIKPHNLILGNDGKLMISDFGLARLAEQPGVTITGELIGSPLYMPPEQISGRSRQVDQRLDIYSLGATMYEWLTLTPPYPGETREQVISKILTTEPPALSLHNPAIPVDLETICLKAIERDPQRRYATAGEFRDDLHRFLDHRPIKARRASLPLRLAKFIRRHELLSLSAAAVVVALALGWALFSKGREVKTQTAAAAMAKEDIEQLKEENRRLLEDFRRLMPLEIGAPLRAAEAAVPVLQEIVTGGRGTGSDAAAMGTGADPATVGTPTGIACRLARDFHDASAPRDWVNSVTDMTPALAGHLRDAFDAWAERPKDAADRIAAFLQARPDHFEAREFHAALMGRLAKAQELLDDAERLIRLRPASPNGLLWRGLARMLLGDVEHSLTDLTKSAKHDGLREWALALRGLALAEDKRSIDAISVLDEVLTIDPDLIVALLGRSYARATLGNLEGAVTDLTRVIEREPKNADVLALRGDRFAALSDYEAAARDYDSAMNLAGRTPAMVVRYLFVRSQGNRTMGGDPTPEGARSTLDGGMSGPTGKADGHSIRDRFLRSLRRDPLPEEATVSSPAGLSALFFLARVPGR